MAYLQPHFSCHTDHADLLDENAKFCSQFNNINSLRLGREGLSLYSVIGPRENCHIFIFSK